MESFQELSLPAFLGHNLKQMNFIKPTEVQAQAIPPALEGKDIIASAQTGTGKTAAFGIPLLVFLENHKDQTAMILTPTRELAMQVLEVLRKLNGQHYLGGSVLLIGGAPMGPQLTALSKKPRLFIGTPGRVIDHLTRKSLKLDKTEFLVLDEADRMLDMGFAPQLDEIRARLTAPRQTLLFSATIPPDIQQMAAKYLKNPVRIAVGAQTQPVEKIDQQVIHTTEFHKPEELEGELNSRQGSVLVFARTQHRVDRIADRLKEKGFKATRIHGGRTQGQRKQAIEHFRSGDYRILVATDIAARGLDIHHIAHVINYDLPRNPEDYIHRVGRTARAGAEGNSLCFLTSENTALWQRILGLMGPARNTITTRPSRFGDMTPKPGRSPQGHPAHSHSSQTRSGQERRGSRPHSFSSKPGDRSNFQGNKYRPSGGFQKNRPPVGHGHPSRGYTSEEFQVERPRHEGQRPEGHRPEGHRPGSQRPNRPWMNSQRSNEQKAKGPWPRVRQASDPPQKGVWQNIHKAEGRVSDKQPFQRPEGEQRFEKPRFEEGAHKKNRHPDGRHQKRSEEHQRRNTSGPGETPKSHGFSPAPGGEQDQVEKNWNKPGAAEGHASRGFREKPKSNFMGKQWGDSRNQGFKPRRPEGPDGAPFPKDDRYRPKGAKPSFDSNQPPRPFGKPSFSKGGFHPQGGQFRPKRHKER